MINKRLSDLSFNEDEFRKAKPLHENALKESGYKVWKGNMKQVKI